MTIPSSQSLSFEVKSTGSEIAFIRVLILRTSSEDFGPLRESSEMIVSSLKIPVLPGQKSHAYISEKVGRYSHSDFCLGQRSSGWINQDGPCHHISFPLSSTANDPLGPVSAGFCSLGQCPQSSFLLNFTISLTQ